MQISRLFETMYILLERSTVTAGELAERFEVSTRTIYRDIDALAQAGMPIYAKKGKGGGISLIEGFVLDKSMLSDREQGEILAALKGLSASNYREENDALRKLSDFFGKSPEEWIKIDFTGWDGMSHAFDTIKQAVLEKRALTFRYFGSSGEGLRTVEPLQLWFKERSWYLRAFCRERLAERTFKLSRMRDIGMSEERFERPAGAPPPAAHPGPPEIVRLVLKIDKSQAFRVYDEFPAHAVKENPDGSFTVTMYYPPGEWISGFVLGFGSHAIVLEPGYIREHIKNILKNSLKNYSEYDMQMSSYVCYIGEHQTNEEENKMDYANMKFCQSCSMPLQGDEILGTNADGSKNEDYCSYCYKDGAFTQECTMEEMIDFCAPMTVQHSPGKTEESVRAEMRDYFPKLKRWAK